MLSRTLLEVTTGVLAAVLVFLFALRVVLILIKQIAWYVSHTFNASATDEGNHTMMNASTETAGPRPIRRGILGTFTLGIAVLLALLALGLVFAAWRTIEPAISALPLIK